MCGCTANPASNVEPNPARDAMCGMDSWVAAGVQFAQPNSPLLPAVLCLVGIVNQRPIVEDCRDAGDPIPTEAGKEFIEVEAA